MTMSMVRVTRLSILHIALAVFALALVGRSAKVQVWDRKQWDQAAEKQAATSTRSAGTM